MAAPTRRRASARAGKRRAGASALEVVVLDRQRKRGVNARRLCAVIERGAAALGVGAGEVAVVLGRDALLRRLNRAYRHKAAPTDVLAFAGTRRYGMLGDIVISVDAAERSAREEGHGLAEELDLLALHGLLHLLGYDHERDDGTMRRLEHRLRRRLLGRAPGTRA